MMIYPKIEYKKNIPGSIRYFQRPSAKGGLAPSFSTKFLDGFPRLYACVLKASRFDTGVIWDALRVARQVEEKSHTSPSCAWVKTKSRPRRVYRLTIINEG